MWSDLFDSVLTLSWQAGIIALVIMALRPLLKRAPRWAVCLLWLLVAVRLLLPASLTPQSAVSLQSEEPLPARAYHEMQQREETYAYTLPEQRTEEMQVYKAETVSTRVLPRLWLIGVGCMLLYMVLSYYRVWLKTLDAPRLFDNVYQCDEYGTPFVLGLFAPRIYVPSTVSQEDLPQVLAHERCHLRRRDHLVKLLAFLLLALHWFNPVLWAAYILLGRDMERACDELALKDADTAQRAAYSRALVSCAATPRATALCPLAFGEVAVKERVKAVLTAKKTARWALVLVGVAAVVICIFLLTKPNYATVGTLNAEKLYAMRVSSFEDEGAEDIFAALGFPDMSRQSEVSYAKDTTDGDNGVVILYDYKTGTAPQHSDSWHQQMALQAYVAMALIDDIDWISWQEPTDTTDAILNRGQENLVLFWPIVTAPQYREIMDAARQSPAGLATLIETIQTDIKNEVTIYHVKQAKSTYVSTTWDAKELYPYVWTGALAQSAAEEAVYRLGAYTMAATYGYSDVLTRIHQEQEYTGVDIYFCLPEGETFTGVDTTLVTWMSGLCYMTNAMLPQSQWTRISIWDGTAGEAHVMGRSADIHYGQMDLETFQTITKAIRSGVDRGSVSPVETLNGVPSMSPPSPENGSSALYDAPRLPLWMQNNSVVYYDGTLQRTIGQGGDLTEDEIASRQDIQMIGMYDDTILVEPCTKVEYDLHGFLQNVYYLNGFGEYQLAPLSARTTVSLPRWMVPNSFVHVDENMVLSFTQGNFLLPEEIEARKDIRKAGGITAGALACEPNMMAQYGADGQITMLYRKNDDGTYSGIRPENWPVYTAPTAGQ